MYDDVYMKLLQDLETFRLENKLTQQHLAEQLDVSLITVNRWLNGHTKPSKIQTYHIEKLISKRTK